MATSIYVCMYLCIYVNNEARGRLKNTLSGDDKHCSYRCADTFGFNSTGRCHCTHNGSW